MIRRFFFLFVLFAVTAMVLFAMLSFAAYACPDGEGTCYPTPTIDSSTFCHPGAYEGGAYLCPTTAPNTDETRVPPYPTYTPVPTSDPSEYPYPAPEVTYVYEDPYPLPPVGGVVEAVVQQEATSNEPPSLWDWFVTNVLSKPTSHTFKKGQP